MSVTLVYELIDVPSGECKTGIAFEDRFDARLREHEVGRVKAVRHWRGPVQVRIVARFRDRRAASRLAHSLERGQRCLPTRGP